MPRTEWKDKLNEFEALVINDAKDKRNALMDKTNAEYTRRIDARETELLEDAYKDIQHTLHKAQKEAHEHVLQAEFTAKRKLILRREEIIGEVMEAAKEKLTAFTKTAEYKTWLKNKTAESLKEIGEGKKTVTLSANDGDIAGEIKNMSEDVTVEISEDKAFFGGVKAVNTDRKIAVDNSFGELLLEEEKKFLQSSGLSID